MTIKRAPIVILLIVFALLFCALGQADAEGIKAVYGLSAEPNELVFIGKDYTTAPEAQTVSIINIGDTTIKIAPPASNEQYTITPQAGWTDQSDFDPGFARSFTVRPIPNKSKTAYAQTLRVSSVNASVDIDLSFILEEDVKKNIDITGEGDFPKTCVDGQTLNLTGDVTPLDKIIMFIPTGATVTLNLNDRSLSRAGDVLEVRGGGKLIIKGTSGKIDNNGVIDYTCALRLRDNISLLLESGTITASKNKLIYSIDATSCDGDMSIKGGKVSSDGWRDAIAYGGTGNVTVSGGTVQSFKGCAIRYSGEGKVSISGGTVESKATEDGRATVAITEGASKRDEVVLEITGNNTVVKNTDASDEGHPAAILNASKADVSISGGAISSICNNTIFFERTDGKNVGDLFISGGSVTNNVNDIGAEIVKDTNFRAAIYMKSGGVATISSGAVISCAGNNKRSGAIYLNEATLNLNGCTVSHLSNEPDIYAVYSLNSTVNINGGAVLKGKNKAINVVPTLGTDVTMFGSDAFEGTGLKETEVLTEYKYLKSVNPKLESVTADGSDDVSTTTLTLTFDKDITNFIITDIVLTGADKVSLTKESGTTGVYKLKINGVTVGDKGNVGVKIEKAGYTMIPDSKDVSVRVINSTVTPSAAVYTKRSTTGVALTFDPKGNGVPLIRNGQNALGSWDYSEANNVYTILPNYLDGLSEGTHTLTFDVLNGTSPTAAITVQKKQLAVTGTTVSNKPYDGTTDATIYIGDVTGISPIDNVTVTAAGEFADANAENDKEVPVTYAMSGINTDYYIAPASETIKADITALSVTGVTVSNAAPLVGDVLTAENVTPVGATVNYLWNDEAASTTSSVTLGEGDIGKQITVTVTGYGNYTDSFTSVPTSAVKPNVVVDGDPDYKPNPDGRLDFNSNVPQSFLAVADPIQCGLKNGTPATLEKDKDYTIANDATGGMTLTLTNTYLNGLAAGDYTLKINYKGNVSVDISFKVEPPIDASVDPLTDDYDKYTSSQGLSFTLAPGSYKLNAIMNGTVDLVAGTDYTVSGDVYTIARSYLDRQPTGELTLTFDMSGGSDPTATVTVTDTTPASVTPATANYDKYTATAGPKFTLAPGGYKFAALKNGETALSEGTDYTVSTDVYTITQSYLNKQPTGTLTLTFDMSGGSDPTATVSIFDSSPVNAYVTPASASYDKRAATAGLAFTLYPGSYALTALKNGETALAEGTDYAANGGIYTLTREYLDKQPLGAFTLTFVMTGGSDPTAKVEISDTTPEDASVAPANVDYDRVYAETGIEFTLNPGGYVLAAITNGETALAAGTDYTANGNVYTVTREYLGKLPLGLTTLTFNMTGGANPTANINVYDGSIVDAKVTPAKAEFDINAIPTGLEFALEPGSYALTAIMNGEYVLTAGKDYKADGNTYTLTRAYLKTLEAGVTTITFDMTGGVDPAVEISVTSNRLLLDKLTLGKGKTVSVSNLLMWKSQKGVKWQSNDKSVLKIIGKGKNRKLKPVELGTATLTATFKSGASLTIPVEVVEREKAATGLKAGGDIKLNVGETYQTTPTVLPDTAADKTVSWFSMKPSVAKVDEKGVIKATGKGECNIIAITSAGARKTLKITVKKAP